MKKKLGIIIGVVFLAAVAFFAIGASDGEDFIRYAEFNVTYEALNKAVDYDISSYDEDVQLDCVELLAFLGAKYGGDFSQYKGSDMDNLVERLRCGESIEEITADMKYYNYYRDVYGAVIGEFVGEFTEGGETSYGLKVYSPIAATFPFSDYDDFGASRTYGYKRRHLGHDMMAATGTPVIAIESGTVECLGWNQYGGWRIGIRSFDNKRYYYYAHLRQNRPYHVDLEVGDTVAAGDVIGYVGRTGYSANENVNGIEVSHLHLGLQLIFDESQKESDNEIWVDLYAITKLLQKHRSEVVRVAETKEFYRASPFSEKSAESSQAAP